MSKSEDRFRVDRSFGIARMQEEVARLEKEVRIYTRSLRGEELDLFASAQDTRIIDFPSQPCRTASSRSSGQS